MKLLWMMPASDSESYQFHASGALQSQTYQDIYFSTDDGLAEARYVFIDANKLTQRWKGQPLMTIAEAGFGTGLNFMATWQRWKEDPQRSERLQYVSIEKHPLPLSLLKEAHSFFPELQGYSDTWLQHHPPKLPGVYSCYFEHGQLELLFGVGDILEVLGQLEFEADIWFLDGFAPKKNPQMWSTEVLDSIAKHTKLGGGFSTFTAAGAVRRSLIEVGFEVEKYPGFGKKREMLRGIKKEQNPLKAIQAPWFRLPKTTSAKPKHAVVIGAGLAGTGVANALARRGMKVSVLERKDVAAGASGNPVGLYQPMLNLTSDQTEEYYRSAFIWLCHYLNELKPQEPPLYEACGIFHPATSENLCHRFHQLLERWGPRSGWLEYQTAAEASQRLGIDSSYGGLWIAKAGKLDPRRLCKVQLEHPNIEYLPYHPVTSVNWDNELWHIGGESFELQASVVIFANANEIQTFSEFEWLPISPVGGQLSLVSLEDADRPASAACYQGYFSQTFDKALCLGATFDTGSYGAEVTGEGHQKNWELLRDIYPGYASKLWESRDAWKGRSSTRCASLDHLPLIGPVPQFQRYLECFEALKDGKPWSYYKTAPYHSGLYISVGHGSHGILSGSFGGELLAAMICEENQKLKAQTLQALMPARFLVRGLKKGKFTRKQSL